MTLELRTAIIRTAVAEMLEPKRTQFAVRLRRALAAESWQQRDAELNAIEIEVLSMRKTMAARSAS